MENVFYMLNIGVAGIKCIKEEVRLNFYKKTVDKNFNPEKYRIKGIYGENGSGKSALITAVKIFQDLVINDNYLSESKTQAFLGEIINKKTQYFRFNCEFLADLGTKVVYNYSFHIGKSENGLYEIKYEILKAKRGNYANNKYETIFESKNGELIYVNCIESQREIIEKRSINLLSSHTFLYLCSFNLKKDGIFDKDFYSHILACLILVITLKVYIAEEDQHELFFLRKRLRESGLDKQGLIDGFFAQEDNINIFSGVNEKRIDKKYFNEYEKKVSQLTQFIKIFKPDLVSIDIEKKENGEQYACDLNLNYGDYVINKEFESTGIKKLIRLFDCFTAASTGGIVFVDEMDSNLNDVYLCKLIEYFMYYGKGQLCFTTHNLDPMTILKENRNSIDFLSSDNHLVSWVSRGNASPENCYKNGMIEDSPFNIDATDFVGILGE